MLTIILGAERAMEHRQKVDVGRRRSVTEGGMRFSHVVQGHARGKLSQQLAEGGYGR